MREDVIEAADAMEAPPTQAPCDDTALSPAVLGSPSHAQEDTSAQKRASSIDSAGTTAEASLPFQNVDTPADAVGAPTDLERLVSAAIATAEEIRDPLEDLVNRVAEDPGAAFTPEVLQALAELKKQNRAAFETLRSRLKQVRCRVTALDEAIAGESGEAGRREPTQADILVELASDADLFHAPDGTAFADVDINGHRETWSVRTKGFRRWLARRFFEETKGAPSSEALHSALNVLEAKAHFDGPERPIYIRVARLDDRLYLDLGDEAWRAVEIPRQAGR